MIIAYGILTLMSQTILLQELSVLFRRNEVVLGILFFSWLCGSGLGSSFFRFLPDRLKTWEKLPDWTACATAWLVFVLIFIIRAIFGFYQFSALPNLVYISLISFCLIAPVSFLIGLCFTAYCARNPSHLSLNQVFLLESLGAFIGGMVITFSTDNRPDALIYAFSLIVVLHVFMARRHSSPLVSLLISIFLVFLILNLFPGFSNGFIQLSRKLQFRHSQVLNTQPSVYGDLTTVQNQNLKTTYYNGENLFSWDTLPYEETGLLPALAAPSTKKILVLGFCSPPQLQQLLRFKPQEITLIFQDNKLDLLLDAYFDQNNPWPGATALGTIHADPFRWPSHGREQYDLVLIAKELPTSLADNRYFSDNFLSRVREVLNPNGVAVLSLRYEENFSDPYTLANFRIIRDTLRTCFSEVAFIPAEKFYFFASNSPLKLTSLDLLGKLKKLHPAPLTLNKPYLDEYIAPERLCKFDGLLDSAGNKTVNHLFSMSLYLNSLKKQLKADLRQSWFALALLAVLVLSLLGAKMQNLKHLFLADRHSLYLFFLGFNAMTGEILLLLFYQSVSGFIYFYYAFITAAFMLGLSLGSGYTLIFKQTKAFQRLMFACLSVLWVLAIGLLYQGLFSSTFKVLSIPLVVQLLNIVGGFFLGAAFNLEGQAAYKLDNSALNLSPRLYSFDLFGSSLAALLVPLVCIPLMGMTATAFLSALLLLAVISSQGRLSREP